MSEKPTQLQDVSLETLRDICQEYLDFFEDIHGENYIEERVSKYKQYIFETAVKTVFGEGVFRWIWDKMNENDEE